MIISKENCKNCDWFKHPESNPENMIKNNICAKREAVGCPYE